MATFTKPPFFESCMEVVSIQENYFCESTYAEFSAIGNIREPGVEPFAPDVRYGLSYV